MYEVHPVLPCSSSPSLYRKSPLHFQQLDLEIEEVWKGDPEGLQPKGGVDWSHRPSECEWSVLSGQEPNQQGGGGGTLLFSLFLISYINNVKRSGARRRPLYFFVFFFIIMPRKFNVNNLKRNLLHNLDVVADLVLVVREKGTSLMIL